MVKFCKKILKFIVGHMYKPMEYCNPINHKLYAVLSTA